MASLLPIVAQDAEEGERVRATVRETPGPDEKIEPTYDDSGGVAPTDERASKNVAPDEVKVLYVPPAGWKAEQVEGSRHKVAIGPPVDGFFPNISISEIYFEGDLEGFITQNLEQLKSQKEESRFLGRSSFSTKSGLKGVKLQVEMNRNGRWYRNTYYVFRPLRTKPIVLLNCAAPQGAAGQMAALFDQAMKTVDIRFAEAIPAR